MSSLYKPTCFLALSMLGAFIACDGDVDTPGDTSSSTTTAGTGGARPPRPPRPPRPTPAAPALRRRLHRPGPVPLQLDCAANEYCLQDNRYPIGNCTPFLRLPLQRGLRVRIATASRTTTLKPPRRPERLSLRDRGQRSPASQLPCGTGVLQPDGRVLPAGGYAPWPASRCRQRARTIRAVAASSARSIARSARRR